MASKARHSMGATEDRKKEQESLNMLDLQRDQLLHLLGCSVRKDQRQLLSFFPERPGKGGIISAIIENGHHVLKTTYLFCRLNIVTSLIILHLTWLPDPPLPLSFKIQCPAFVVTSLPLPKYKLFDVVFVSFSKFSMAICTPVKSTNFY